MSFDTLYKNRPYLFTIQKDSFEENFEIVKEIFDKLSLPLLNNNISFIVSNYDHDLYKVIEKDKKYCIKYSFDSKNKSLKKEADILKYLPKEVSPELYFQGSLKFGDMIHYSVSSWIEGESLRYLGISPLLNNLDQFLSSYSKFAETKTEAPTFIEYLNSFLKNNNINNLPEDALDAISSHTDLNKIKKILESVEKEILLLTSSPIFRKNELCHGMMKPSNIIMRDQNIRLIDFSDANLSNHYMDLSYLMIQCGSHKEQEKRLIELWLTMQGKKATASDYAEYALCYEVSIRMVFMQILMGYLKEIYVFSSSRPMKILELIDLFSKNSEKLFKLPAVMDHYEFVYKNILEPILGSEYARFQDFK